MSKPVLITLTSIFGALVLIGAALFFIDNGVTNSGNKQEAALSGQYDTNQAELSSCLQRIETAAGTTTQQTEAMTNALTAAVKGRYEGLQSNQGAMFSGMVEDYPELAPYDDAFARAFNVIDGCQQDYQSTQSKLRDMVREYDAWRTGSWTVRQFGDGEFPSNNLKADGYTGESALVKMRALVVTSEASEAYETGELEIEDPWAAK